MPSEPISSEPIPSEPIPSKDGPPEEFTSAQRWWIAFIMIAIPVLVVAVLHDHPNYFFTNLGTGKLPKMVETHVTNSVDGIERKIDLPYSVQGDKKEIMNFHILLDYKAGDSSTFWVIPDDCVNDLTINTAKVELTGKALEHRCDWRDGFRIDLGTYLHEGKNDIFLAIQNVKGKMGLTFEPILK